MNLSFQWPPPMPELGDVVKSYIDSGGALSIADRSGVYAELEDELRRLHGRKYALLTSSGTMALYSAFFALGLRAGDEVICTAFSYHATAAPLLHLGVSVVFCDVEPDTGNIDTEKLRPLITGKTKAVVTNDQWGHPVDKDAILAICREHGLAYVEDCSHAHFSAYKGRYVGTFGDVACFSLQGNKLLSGGEGGFLLTDNQDIYEQAVLLGHNLKRPFSEVTNPIYKGLERTGFGLKLRIHPLAAVMVLHMLRNHCFSWIASRHRVLEYFQKRLAEETPLLPMTKRDYVTSMGAWYGFKPRCPFPALGINRDDLCQHLRKNGFDVDVPGSGVLPEYRLFQNPEVAPPSFARQPPQVSTFSGAAAYCASTLSLPTFTFDNQLPIVEAYVQAFRDYFSHRGARP